MNNPSKSLDKKALIMGNGPSLRTVDLRQVRKDPSVETFACNRIDLIFEDEKDECWRPDNYVCFTSLSQHDPKWKKSIERVASHTGTRCYLLPECRNWLGTGDHITYVTPYEHDRHTVIPDDLFETPIEQKFLKSYSASTSLIQLALHRGFRHLLLVGMDGYQSIRRENHFSSEYGYEPGNFSASNRRIVELHSVLKKHCAKYSIVVENLSKRSILTMHESSNWFLKEMM